MEFWERPASPAPDTSPPQTLLRGKRSSHPGPPTGLLREHNQCALSLSPLRELAWPPGRWHPRTRTRAGRAREAPKIHQMGAPVMSLKAKVTAQMPCGAGWLPCPEARSSAARPPPCAQNNRRLRGGPVAHASFSALPENSEPPPGGRVHTEPALPEAVGQMAQGVILGAALG